MQPRYARKRSPTGEELKHNGAVDAGARNSPRLQQRGMHESERDAADAAYLAALPRVLAALDSPPGPSLRTPWPLLSASTRNNPTAIREKDRETSAAAAAAVAASQSVGRRGGKTNASPSPTSADDPLARRYLALQLDKRSAKLLATANAPDPAPPQSPGYMERRGRRHKRSRRHRPRRPGSAGLSQAEGRDHDGDGDEQRDSAGQSSDLRAERTSTKLPSPPSASAAASEGSRPSSRRRLRESAGGAAGAAGAGGGWVGVVAHAIRRVDTQAFEAFDPDAEAASIGTFEFFHGMLQKAAERIQDGVWDMAHRAAIGQLLADAAHSTGRARGGIGADPRQQGAGDGLGGLGGLDRVRAQVDELFEELNDPEKDTLLNELSAVLTQRSQLDKAEEHKLRLMEYAHSEAGNELEATKQMVEEDIQHKQARLLKAVSHFYSALQKAAKRHRRGARRPYAGAGVGLGVDHEDAGDDEAGGGSESEEIMRLRLTVGMLQAKLFEQHKILQLSGLEVPRQASMGDDGAPTQTGVEEFLSIIQDLKKEKARLLHDLAAVEAKCENAEERCGRAQRELHALQSSDARAGRKREQEELQLRIAQLEGERGDMEARIKEMGEQIENVHGRYRERIEEERAEKERVCAALRAKLKDQDVQTHMVEEEAREAAEKLRRMSQLLDQRTEMRAASRGSNSNSGSSGQTADPSLVLALRQEVSSLDRRCAELQDKLVHEAEAASKAHDELTAAVANRDETIDVLRQRLMVVAAADGSAGLAGRGGSDGDGDGESGGGGGGDGCGGGGVEETDVKRPDDQLQSIRTTQSHNSDGQAVVSDNSTEREQMLSAQVATLEARIEELEADLGGKQRSRLSDKSQRGRNNARGGGGGGGGGGGSSDVLEEESDAYSDHRGSDCDSDASSSRSSSADARRPAASWSAHPRPRSGSVHSDSPPCSAHSQRSARSRRLQSIAGRASSRVPPADRRPSISGGQEPDGARRDSLAACVDAREQVLSENRLLVQASKENDELRTQIRQLVEELERAKRKRSDSIVSPSQAAKDFAGMDHEELVQECCTMYAEERKLQKQLRWWRDRWAARGVEQVEERKQSKVSAFGIPSALSSVLANRIAAIPEDAESSVGASGDPAAEAGGPGVGEHVRYRQAWAAAASLKPSRPQLAFLHETPEGRKTLGTKEHILISRRRARGCVSPPSPSRGSIAVASTDAQAGAADADPAAKDAEVAGDGDESASGSPTLASTALQQALHHHRETNVNEYLHRATTTPTDSVVTDILLRNRHRKAGAGTLSPMQRRRGGKRSRVTHVLEGAMGNGLQTDKMRLLLAVRTTRGHLGSRPSLSSSSAPDAVGKITTNGALGLGDLVVKSTRDMT